MWTWTKPFRNTVALTGITIVTWATGQMSRRRAWQMDNLQWNKALSQFRDIKYSGELYGHVE